MKSLAVIVLLLVSSGCVKRRLTATMSPWVGRNISEVTQEWGPPSNTYDEPGTPFRVFTWSRTRSQIVMQGSVGAAQSREWYYSFWTDQQGKVVKWMAGAR